MGRAMDDDSMEGMGEQESQMTARLSTWAAEETECVIHQDRVMEKPVCKGGRRRLPKVLQRRGHGATSYSVD